MQRQTNIELKNKENTSDEPLAKKRKISTFFEPKSKGPALQELVAKMTAVDGFSIAAISNSESLRYLFPKSGYSLPKSHTIIQNLVIAI